MQGTEDAPDEKADAAVDDDVVAAVPQESAGEVVSVDQESPADPAEEQDAVDADREPVPTPEPTGHPGVDEVLTSLAGLEASSVHDHVAVFEAAHTSLRRALDEDLADDDLADDDLTDVG